VAEPGRDIVCVGTSHHTASLAFRERFALGSPRGKQLCAQLAAREDVHELVAIATCNRSELYLVTSDLEGVAAVAVAALAELAEATLDEVDTVLAVHEGAHAAAEHLFRTAGGIESVVTGEAQIQGQIRTAHESALEAGTCGPVLDRLMRRAIEVGKRARTDTRIAEGHASVGSVAAELVAGHRGGSLDDAQVVVVGAGKMGSLAARSLAHRGARRIDVANRSIERASAVVQCSGAEGVGVPFTELDHELRRCDVVVSCTNAPHVLIGPERIAEAMRERDERPLVLVDLAVPRDIDPACGAIEGVHAFDLDDLERIVAQTLDVRSEEVDAVEQLATDAAREFAAWLRAERATPRIRAMRERAEQLRQQELSRVLERMPHVAAEDRERIDRLTRTIVNRVLHEQTVQLRRAAELT
jgi:glutamyl-tRNA reductase